MADDSMENIEKQIEELKKSGARFSKEQQLIMNNLLKNAKTRDALSRQEQQMAKAQMDILKQSIEAQKRSIEISLDEAQTHEEAISVLRNQMSHQGVFAEMMGKSNKYLNQQGKTVNFLNREFDVMGATARNLAGSGGLGSLLKSVGLNSAVLGALAAEVDRSLDTWRDFRNRGNLLDESMMTLRDASANSGMSFSTFQSAMAGASDDAKRFGLDTLGGLTKQSRIALQGIGNLGMTSKMTTEALSDYMEIEALRTTYSAMQSKEEQRATSARFVGFVKDMDTFSKAIGVSRKELMNAFKNIMKDTEFGNIIKGMGKKEGDKLGQNLAAVSVISADVGSTMFSMVKNQKIFGSAIRDGTSAVLEGFAPGITDFTKNLENMSPAQVAEGMAKFGKMAQGNTTQLAAMARAGDEGAKILLDMSANAEKYVSMAERQRQIEENQGKGFGLFMKNLEQFGEKLGGLFTGLGNVFGKIVEPMFEIFSYGLNVLMIAVDKLSAGVNWASEKIDELFENFPKLYKALQMVPLLLIAALATKSGRGAISTVAKSPMNIAAGLGKKVANKVGLGGVVDTLTNKADDMLNNATLGSKDNPMYVYVLGKAPTLGDIGGGGKKTPSLDDLPSGPDAGKPKGKIGKAFDAIKGKAAKLPGMGMLSKLGVGGMLGVGGAVFSGALNAIDSAMNAGEKLGKPEDEVTLSDTIASGLGGFINGALFGVPDMIADMFGMNTEQVMASLFDVIGDFFKNIYDGIVGIFDGVFANVFKNFGRVFEGLGKIFSGEDILDGIGDLLYVYFFGVPDLILGYFDTSVADIWNKFKTKLPWPFSLAFGGSEAASNTNNNISAFPDTQIASIAPNNEELAQTNALQGEATNKEIADKLGTLVSAVSLQTEIQADGVKETVAATKSRANQYVVAA
jgi:hypothetical protein